MSQVFICGDTGQVSLLETATAILRSQNIDVIRGPANEIGKVKVYTSEEVETLLGDVQVAVFTVRHLCSRELMAASPRLLGICYPVIGVETLDLPAANDLGIIVGYGATRGNFIGVAEATLMLILMLLYDVEYNIRLMADRKWRRPLPIARQMEGKTIGIVGFGRIGRALAERLMPFGVEILICSPRTQEKDLPPGVCKTDLDTLLDKSDVISLLTGLTPETRHMIGGAQLARMKPDAFLVNTSRGEVVDEAALIEALSKRRIAGAALDTFATEPLPADSPLRELDNVILTPHTVGHTREGAAEFAPALAENVRRILTGELPLYCKNPEAEPAWRERVRRLGPSRVTPG